MADAPDQRPVVLASDADRERVALLLRDAAGEGRLTLSELSERLSSAYGARTSSELEALTRDLPAPAAAAAPGPPERRRRTRWVVALMSGTRRAGRWRAGERVAALTVMGGLKLDLRDAELEGPPLDITAVSVMGGVRIVVPEGVEVEVSGLSIMGGRKVNVADVPPRPGTPAIRVRAFSLMGGLRVQSRPARRLTPESA